MSRYYILTEHNGLGVIEATAVDESDPFKIHFTARSGITSFDRHELLWWSSVESSPPAPFDNLDQRHQTDAPASFGVAPPNWPWQPMRNEAQRNLDISRRSVSVLGVLVEAARLGVPPGWKKAVLEIKVIYELTACRYRLTHRLRNPDAETEALDFSDALFAAIEVFHRIAVEGGQNWNQSTLTLHLDDHGRCSRTEASFGYGTNFGPR